MKLTTWSKRTSKCCAAATASRWTPLIGRRSSAAARPSLRFYHHHGAEVGGVIELARFPIRHANASVCCRPPRQVALVQSVARREFEKVGHRAANEVRVRRFGVTPAIDVGLHDPA